MRLLSYLTTFLTAVLLTACGGGGGSPGLSSGSDAAFLVSAPTKLTLQTGSSQQYAVKGGVKPYSVFSTDPAVAVGWLVDDNTVAIGSIVGGRATVTIADAKGTKFDIDVTVSGNAAFFTTAPTSLTIPVGAVGARTFSLGGGVPPYTASSSNNSIATATVSGRSVLITGIKASATTATVSLFDSTGAPVLTSAVTVEASSSLPLALNPTSATAFVSDRVVSKITGGTPPYRVSVAIPDAVSATIVNQDELNMTVLRVVSPVTITVLDAADKSVVFSMTGILGTNGFRLSPAAVTIAENETQPISLTVYGASTAGPSKVFSSNTGLLTASVSGSTVTVARLPYSAGSPAVAAVVGPPAVPAVAAVPGSCVLTDTTVTITLVDAIGAIGTSDIKILNSVTGGGTCVPP